MHLLLPLASLLGIEVEELTARLKRNALAWGAIAAFGSIAVVFLLIALNNAVTAWLGPLWGPLALGGAALLIALAIYAGTQIAAGIAARRNSERRLSAERTALVTTAAVSAVPMLLKSPLVRKLGLPIGGALAALYLLRKPGGHRGD